MNNKQKKAYQLYEVNINSLPCTEQMRVVLREYSLTHVLNNPSISASSIPKQLSVNMFVWNMTIQGFRFWRDVHISYVKNKTQRINVLGGIKTWM